MSRSFKSTASPYFEPVYQTGAALGKSPLPMYVVTPTELHDEQASWTSKRTKGSTTVAWIPSWPKQYQRDTICPSRTQPLQSTVRSCSLTVNDFFQAVDTYEATPITSMIPSSRAQAVRFRIDCISQVGAAVVAWHRSR